MGVMLYEDLKDDDGYTVGRLATPPPTPRYHSHGGIHPQSAR